MNFTEKSWIVSATAFEPDIYDFLWICSGFYAFFQATVFLESSTDESLVDAGPENCCTTPSQSFHYSGTFSFPEVTVDKIVGFTVGGDNFDPDNRLTGTLNLQQVNEPGMLTLLARLACWHGDAPGRSLAAE